MNGSNESSSAGVPSERVRRACTLDNFARAVSATKGLSLVELSPMASLVVRTMNSSYRIVILEPPAAVLVQGGEFFPERTEAHVSGSCLGGSILKTSWLGVGFSIEICGPAGRIVTSPVRSIEVLDAAAPGPF